MAPDPGVDALIQQWAEERSQTPEDVEVSRIASEWLAEAPGIPMQRTGESTPGWAPIDYADHAYVRAMRDRLPHAVPGHLLAEAARWWRMAGGVAEAQRWWDAGISPLDQRALEYRAAGLRPEDLSAHLGPYTVLEHLRKGSAAAWCVARLARARRASAS